VPIDNAAEPGTGITAATAAIASGVNCGAVPVRILVVTMRAQRVANSVTL